MNETDRNSQGQKERFVIISRIHMKAFVSAVAWPFIGWIVYLVGVALLDVFLGNFKIIGEFCS